MAGNFLGEGVDDSQNEQQQTEDDSSQADDAATASTTNHHRRPCEPQQQQQQEEEEDNDDGEDDDNDDDNNNSTNEEMEDEEDNEGDDDDDDENDEDQEDDENDEMNEQEDQEDEEEDEEEGSEDDDDEEEDDDDESDDDDEDGSSSRKMVTHDGREISEYEMLRLERIRRNKEKLAQLGLEGQEGKGVLGDKKKKAKKKRPRPSVHAEAPKRSSLSRQSKGKIKHYAAELPSVTQMLKGQMEVKKAAKEAKPRKSKDPSERMDRVIHDEFRAIRSHKNHVLRQAEKDNRAAQKEVKYWKSQVELAKRKELRDLKRQEQMLHRREEEKEVLGGMTARQLLHEIDKRMPELLEATEEYDEKYEAEERLRQRELERFETEERLKSIEALERFPKIVKDSSTLLSAVLVERAPKDPPPPRRSKRAGDEQNTEKHEHPKKKKAKVKENQEIWSEQAPISAVSLPTAEEDEDNTLKVPAVAGKKRKRGVRNVGGWVSPGFAKGIDRTWLERDVPAEKFDLKSFVPQVGDALLYYPKGHFEFLARHPDILGKKTRQSTRVPLWERKADTKDGDDAEEVQPSQSWYTEEWAQSIGDDKKGGIYPILCTVQTVCAEFPPDPNTKVVKSKEGGDGETVKKIFFKQAKGVVAKEIAKIRLAVTLRPLSPVLPGKGLPLPPIFSVVTFPSAAKPFLVPFAWAYSLNHGMQFGTTVFQRSEPNSLMRISKIDVPESISKGGRIDPEMARTVLSFLGEEQVRRESLIKILSEESRQLSLCDALVALATISSSVKKEGSIDSSTTTKAAFIDLICDTLPVWDSVTVTTKDVYDRKQITVRTVSPWELGLVQKGHQPQEATPDTIAELPSRRDESLRMKIEAILDEVVKDHPSGILFAEPITEDIAPSYFCAVPVGMSVSRIHKRLRGTPKSRSCFYRNIGAILSDVSAIVENCLLYNSPDSEVVQAAAEVTAMLKDGISRVVRDHNKEVNASLKADEERRRHVLQLCGAGSQSSSRSSFAVCRIRKPYKHSLYQDWLQEIVPPVSSQIPQTGRPAPNVEWVPQAGDEIHYSRSRHSAFVKGHHSALELDQCEVVASSGALDETAETEGEVKDWLVGQVVWTRAAFPRLLTKKDMETPAFSTSATLLAVGLTLKGDGEENDRIHVVYWRPCMFNFERSGDCDGQCKMCRMPLNGSFLRTSSPEMHLESQDQVNLPVVDSKAIEQSLSLLKKRVLSGIHAPSHVDPKLSRTSIKQGYKVPSPSRSLQSLPTFENILYAAVASQPHGTRTTGVRFEPPPTALLGCGYLAHWMSENPKKNRDVSPKQHETISPWPNLCLELVRLRLKNGFYRSYNAVENDIIESFASVCLLLVAEAANQKKFPLSVKRVAKLLASHKGKIAPDLKQDEQKKWDGEEDAKLREWVEKLQPIRDLYSTALVAISDTERFQRINGLYITPEPVLKVREGTVVKEKQSAAQAEAREKLRRLLDAVGKDPLSDEFIVNKKGPGDAKVPVTKLSVICDGEKIEYKTFMTKVKRAVAKTVEKEVKVKILCSGKEVHVDREVLKTTSINTVMNGSDVRLKIIANGEEICVPDTSKLGRSAEVKEVIKDFMPIGAKDLDGSETLVRFLFARPGRSSLCARCGAHRRNMLICRVRRAHANNDFDWLEFFQDQNGLDEILSAMKTETKVENGDSTAVEQDQKELVTIEEEADESPTSVAEDTNTKLLMVGNNEPPPPNGKESSVSTAEKTIQEEKETTVEGTEEPMEDIVSGRRRSYSTRSAATSAGKEEDNDSSSERSATQNVQNATEGLEAKGIVPEDLKEEDTSEHPPREVERDGQFDPEEYLAKAEDAARLSELVLEEARRYAGAPPRLSKEFVETAMPVDHADGHYVYCICCGFAGELLCCDGCANVVHNRCIGLEAVPDGEWFCEECTSKRQAEKNRAGGAGSAVLSVEEATPDLPFGRLVFDSDRADRLSSLVQDLHESRPDVLVRRERDRKRKEKKQRRTKSDESNSDESDAEAGNQETQIDPSDPMSDLPEMAKKFTSAMGFTSFSDFLSAKTSVLAGEFARWRKKNKLPELRGSGTTAYVSSWKRTCREAAATKGLDIPDDGGGVKWKDDSDLDIDSGSDSGKSRRSPSKKTPRSPRRMPSKKPIEEPLESLSLSSREFLQSIGIRDADAFMKARTTDIAEKFVKWRKHQKLPKLKSNGEVATVSAWKSTVRKAEEMLDAVKKRKTGPTSHVATTPAKTDTSLGRAERARKRKDRASVGIAGSPSNDHETEQESSDDEPPFEDPLDVLSQNARAFLRDQKIKSAEEFISLRSGELGDRLGGWRKNKGLPKLRGSGEGATISAWKSLCRKAVVALERYRKKMRDDDSNVKSPESEVQIPAERKGNKTDGSQVIEVYEALPPGRKLRRSRRMQRDKAEEDDAKDTNSGEIAKDHEQAEESAEQPERKRLRRK